MPGTDRRPGRAALAGLIALVALGACGDDDRLEGERIRIRPDVTAEAGSGATRPLPDPVRNSDWTQTSGTPTHNAGHLAGPSSLNRAWTADAGTGSGDQPITSQPVVVGGTVYTLDAAGQISAFGAGGGARRWRTDLTPEGERGRSGFGGGLAADGGRLFAATGFGEVVALDAGSGQILWRQFFGAPFRAAPAAARGLVVAVTRDNRAAGLDAESGEVRWQLQGNTGEAGLLGGASPAIAGDIALLPFTSGELMAVAANSGRALWSALLTSGRRGMARSGIVDVTGDPAAVGPYVIAANQAGRMMAVDARSGQRAWTRSIGSPAPLWPAGDTVFLVSDTAVMMRVSARDGSVLWSRQLPAFGDPEDRDDPIAYSGPVLAGGRLLVTDSEGTLWAFDPQSGSEVGQARLEGGSTTGPVVAGGTIYVLTDRGTLHAFR